MKTRFFFSALLTCLITVSANAATNIGEMFSQGSGSAEIRTMFFERDYDGSKQDLGEQAIGGIFHYKTAPLYGISLGVGFYTSNNINSDDDKGGYDLLQNSSSESHKSLTKLGEYFIQGEWADTKIKYGAQEVDTPFVNGFDTRMLPKTYKGLSVVNNTVPNLEASLYYLTDTLDRTDTEFTDIASSFNNNMDDNPLYAAGLMYTWNAAEGVKVVPQAWYYTIEDGFGFTYSAVELSSKFSKVSLSLKPSYLIQKAIGDKDGGDLDTHQYGAVGTAKYGDASLSLYYAKTGDDALSTPWGHSKILVQQVLSSQRAEETAYGVKLGYDFSKLGAKGLKFAIFYADYDTPDSGDNAGYDAKELDYDLTYKLPFKALKGLALRFRYADINTDGTHKSVDYTDKRVYATYSFEFGASSTPK
ncbi:OprD family outer membrane porin [Seleniivibrio sp.]|uniref:OprD family outer membrane porin n=1 Tax=Seleniivibrio sp. TaxID=2898801 RepID=UPI0025E0FC7A|nr:OprD family outer membrane porin [Seleniivibrio sp.]MCD8554399.1 OprD family porin [Seleniivibrio sp.]